MSMLLKLNDISLNYGNIKALKGVSLELEKGDIVCLIGANGAGKSSLLKSILAMEKIASGSIEYKDKIIVKPANSSSIRSFFNKSDTGLRTDEIVAKGIALVPEGRRVFADMTVLENLEMGSFLNTDEKYIKRKIDEMYSLFPILENRSKQKAGSLSGGEQQMLAIARALMSSPELLLLDEPGLGLAPLIIKDIFNTILKINKEEGMTIFLVEQNANLALNVSKKGYVMETGNIVLEDESRNLLENEKVKAAYLGE